MTALNIILTGALGPNQESWAAGISLLAVAAIIIAIVFALRKNAGLLMLVLTLIIGALFFTGPLGAQLFSQISSLGNVLGGQ